MEQKSLQQRLAQFGRTLALLFNRAMMYQKSHPVVQQSISDVAKEAQGIFTDISPLVFILNRDVFYVDEEQLDPRINVARIASWFKANSIQSISFESGLTVQELATFTGIISVQAKAGDVSVLKNVLINRGVYHIKINHIVYKKVSEDDHVVSRDAIKNVTPLMDTEDGRNRQHFMETLLESVLTEEFAKTLNIKSLMANPAKVSKNMITADLNHTARLNRGGGIAGGTTEPATGIGSGSQDGPVNIGGSPEAAAGTDILTPAGLNDRAGGDSRVRAEFGDDIDRVGSGEEKEHGHLLLHQLSLMQAEVDKHLQGQGEVDIGDLAAAVFDLKKQLLEGIRTQKALGVAYANEFDIIARADELTDNVLLELIKEEYRNGSITTARLAYLIKRLIPEAEELRRLLPKIKAILIDEGMSLEEYLTLLQELGNELKSDDLARVLQENLSAIGVNGQELIEDIQSDPELAAKLMYLASEIKKGGGNEAELTNVLIDYIESKAGHIIQETAKDAPRDEIQLKKMMNGIESDLLNQLGRLNVNHASLVRMEQRLNERMDSILDNMRLEWLQGRTSTQQATTPSLTVLQTLEQNIGDDEELAELLEMVRDRVEAGDIEENNFSQIHAEIYRLKQSLKGNGGLDPKGSSVLNSDEILFLLEKEIARVKRYDVPFSALAFSLIDVQSVDQSDEQQVSKDEIEEAVLEFIVTAFSEADIIGRIGKNRAVVLLPMTDRDHGKMALDRVIRELHAKQLEVGDRTVKVRAAGIVADFDPQLTLDAVSFAKLMVNQLTDMTTRLKNIQVLF